MDRPCQMSIPGSRPTTELVNAQGGGNGDNQVQDRDQIRHHSGDELGQGRPRLVGDPVLGHEANGNWYPDSIPDTTAGDAQWIQFWRNTVIAMRSVPGADFQFDWTVNAGYRNIPLSEWYPGNDVVDIIGVDAYDGGVPASVSFANRWNFLYNEADGLGAVEAFAVAHGKPLSIPEWGLGPANQPGKGQGGDDPAYINGIASVVANDNVAYESYFDSGQEGTQFFDSPLSIQAYRQGFGANGTAVAATDRRTQAMVQSPAPSLAITGGPARLDHRVRELGHLQLRGPGWLLGGVQLGRRGLALVLHRQHGCPVRPGARVSHLGCAGQRCRGTRQPAWPGLHDQQRGARWPSGAGQGQRLRDGSVRGKGHRRPEGRGGAPGQGRSEGQGGAPRQAGPPERRSEGQGSPAPSGRCGPLAPKARR